MPKEIKRLLKNSWPLLECMKKGKWGKSFEALCSHGLAKSTWGKYTAAVRLFKIFCREQGEKFKLPISPVTSNSWIVWATGGRRVGAGTMKAYLAALHSIGRIFEASQGSRGAEKLLLAGAENLARHSGAQRRKRAPLTFAVLKRLTSELAEKIGGTLASWLSVPSAAPASLDHFGRGNCWPRTAGLSIGFRT